MDRQERPPSLSSGQIKLGLKEEVKKETLLKEISAFLRGFLFYCQRRLSGALRFLWRTSTSGFAFSSKLKFHLQGKLYRKKGQLAFPLTHASLLGVSFSLLVFTSGLGEFLYQRVSTPSSSEGAVIIQDQPSVATEESELFQTKAQTYVVQKGDTLEEIAERFYVPVDVLAFTNQINDPSYKLRPGEKLTIPPVEGLTYEVRTGDTIKLIAERYQTRSTDIVDFNYLFPPYKLIAGQKLVIPYAQIWQAKPATGFLGWPSAPRGVCGPLTLSWPTTSHKILSRFGYRSDPFLGWDMHHGIDLEAHNGDPLYAAADGTVVAVDDSFQGKCYCKGCRSCNFGYGGYLFIDIGGGYQLRYAHISEAVVGVDQEIKRGDLVARSGNTGRTFGQLGGYHLHFELLCNGVRINPLPYLKQ